LERGVADKLILQTSVQGSGVRGQKGGEQGAAWGDFAVWFWRARSGVGEDGAAQVLAVFGRELRRSPDAAMATRSPRMVFGMLGRFWGIYLEFERPGALDE